MVLLKKDLQKFDDLDSVLRLKGKLLGIQQNQFNFELYFRVLIFDLYVKFIYFYPHGISASQINRHLFRIWCS